MAPRPQLPSSRPCMGHQCQAKMGCGIAPVPGKHAPVIGTLTQASARERRLRLFEQHWSFSRTIDASLVAHPVVAVQSRRRSGHARPTRC
jgi:hypothetical protein